MEERHHFHKRGPCINNFWFSNFVFLYFKVPTRRLIEKNSLAVGNVNISTMRYVLGYYTLYRLLTFRSKLDINLLFCFRLQY